MSRVVYLLGLADLPRETTMPKPPPSATIPGVTDTLDFVKNLWGSMSIPGAGMSGMSGMASPAMSVEDLDKRIADMKAVESWLNLNLTMLRGTIQGMEVQRSTLATLKSMGASMAEAMRQSGVSAENMANSPFASFFGQPAQGASSAPPSASSAASRPAGATGGSAQPGTGAGTGAAPGAAPGSAAGADAAMGMPAAMAWWNLLQDQFTQAVTTAMTPAPAPAAATADGKNADKPAAPSQAQAQPAAPDATPENGNGKARAGKPKPDKA
jgi:hypothetical protein